MRVTKDSEVRKKEIIDAAEKLFSENGVANTAISAIVKEVDVAQGLFYYYFKSKDDVIEAISKKYNREIKRKLKENIKMDDFEKDMKQYIENLTKSFDELFKSAQDESIIKKTVEDAKEEASKQLEDIFEKGIEEEKLNLSNTKRIADVIISGVSDLIAKGVNDVEEISDILDELLDGKRK